MAFAPTFPAQPDFIDLLKSTAGHLSAEQQSILLAALSGTAVPAQPQKIVTQSLSSFIKITFFASYLAQTLNNNKYPLAVAWIGALISGGLNAVLGGSLDHLVSRFIKGIKSVTDPTLENWKENIFNLFVLVPTALYFGFAQAGPFGEGTQEALEKLIHLNSDSRLSQIFTAATVATEGLFLTRATLEFLEKLIGHAFLKDKKTAFIISQADQPLLCSLDSLTDTGCASHQKKISTSTRIQLGAAFSFNLFSYALTMANSTQVYLKNNPLYASFLSKTIHANIPFGATALNTTACYNYAGFLISGLKALLDPFFRLQRKISHQADFFEAKGQNAQAICYIGRYLFITIGSYLAYTSSTERAKAGGDSSQDLINFCQDYLLPVMAIIINSYALSKFPGPCYFIKAIGKLCQSFCKRDAYHPLPSTLIDSYKIDIKQDFGPGDLRRLKQTLAWLEKHDSNPATLALKQQLAGISATLDDASFISLVETAAKVRDQAKASQQPSTCIWQKRQQISEEIPLLPHASINTAAP